MWLSRWERPGKSFQRCRETCLCAGKQGIAGQCGWRRWAGWFWLGWPLAPRVPISPDGVLQTKLFPDPTGQVLRQRVAAAKAALPPDLLRFSKLRKVSLQRLEKAIVQGQGAPTDEMRFLAGLLRVRYVFFYPESGDIVLAGPAEGWVIDLAGRAVGLTTGRPVIRLEDLVVALRAFPPGGQSTPVIGCSIDPTQEGLAALQSYLRSLPPAFQHGTQQAVAAQLVHDLRTALGMQQITVQGVPPDTHFAQVMVEADYRMKLIGIGLEQPPVRMVSFVEKVNPAQVSRNALFRWYFVPDYQCVRLSEDRLAIELVGDGVKLIGEDEMVSATGARQGVGRTNAASQAFCASFTKQYAELAERSAVYAELRNLIDLAVAAAFIQREDYYGKSGWRMPLWGDESKFPVRTYPAPKQAESTVNAIFSRSGNRLMTPIGGGVHIEAQQALQADRLLPDEAGRVARLRAEGKLDVSEGRWWWD